MRKRLLAAALIILATGCGEDSNTAPPDRAQLAKTEEVARTYLRAAASGDAERLCAMLTKGALQELGGQAAGLRDPRPITGNSCYYSGRICGGSSVWAI